MGNESSWYQLKAPPLEARGMTLPLTKGPSAVRLRATSQNFGPGPFSKAGWGSLIGEVSTRLSEVLCA